MTSELKGLQKRLDQTYEYYLECDNGCWIPTDPIAETVFDYFNIPIATPEGVVKNAITEFKPMLELAVSTIEDIVDDQLRAGHRVDESYKPALARLQELLSAANY